MSSASLDGGALLESDRLFYSFCYLENSTSFRYASSDTTVLWCYPSSVVEMKPFR